MLKNFTIYTNCIFLYLGNRQHTISLNEYSGKVYWRYKLGTISDVKHPCLYLGVGQDGKEYVVHNHYHVGTAFIDTWEGFSKGQDVYDNYFESCQNTPLKRIENVLNQVIKSEQYSPLSYNCQTTVNLACNNERKSQDVEKWVNRGLLGLLFFSVGAIFLGIANSND